MTKKKGIVFMLALMFALAASLGFSQDSGSGNNGSSSTANGTANATVINNGGGGGAQVQAYPGVFGTPGVFPGFPEKNGEWEPYYNPLFAVIPTAEMESGRGKHDKIHSTPLRPDLMPPENSDPIHILPWTPFGPVYYTDDKAIYTGIVDGKVGEPAEQTLLAGAWDAKKKSHTDRCVVFIRMMNEGITKGFSLGTGGGGAMTPGPGKNNDSIAFAGGGLLGKNTTTEGNYAEFRFVCLNKGSFDAPKAPKPPAPPEAPTTPPPAPAPSPQPEAQAPTPPPPPPPLAPMVAPAPISTPEESCVLPDLTVYFDFDQPRPNAELTVKNEYRNRIKQMASWLENHPTCYVQIQGHTSKEGSYDYNEGLGRRRSKAIYNLLIAYGVSKEQVQFASLGKDFPKSENLPENRRVILRVLGSASGK